MATANRDGSASRKTSQPPLSKVMSRLEYSTQSGFSRYSHHGGRSPSPKTCHVHRLPKAGSAYGPIGADAGAGPVSAWPAPVNAGPADAGSAPVNAGPVNAGPVNAWPVN